MHTFVHENVKEFMAGFRHDAHPMGMLLGGVGALSTFYPDANEIADPDTRMIPTIRLDREDARRSRRSPTGTPMGMPYVYPDNADVRGGNFSG
jgi:citrate synthase